jgi:hypothetical protein
MMAFIVSCLTCLAVSTKARAESGFALQVTPSPLIATIEPGKESILELRINNTGSTKESYKMSLRAFKVNSDTGKVDLQNDSPKDVESFVTFEQPTFSLESGQWLNQRILINTPKGAGFSYNFAVMIVRDEVSAAPNGGAAIQGSLAVFALLNVNRPDATRKLNVVEFTSTKKVYEYLPATLNLKIKNTGNTIIAPKGNIFITRNETDTSHIKLLQVNESGGYIIPDTTRALLVDWSDGFPSKVTSDGITKLNWDLSKLAQLRIGKYTAKAIVIYDDGTRDVPVEAVVSFWVLPWKILLGFAVILGLLGTGIFSVLKKGSIIIKRKPKTNE